MPSGQPFFAQNGILDAGPMVSSERDWCIDLSVDIRLHLLGKGQATKQRGKASSTCRAQHPADATRFWFKLFWLR